jgi:predicted ribosomally synthesized peptide with SipW-like signal peptide
MNKKLIISLSTIAAIAMIAIGATTAYFSNTETSPGNTFIAGAIDLKVDSACTCNGETVTSCTWALSDLDGKLFFNFTDVKPGDDGEDTISLHVDNNPAWVCAEISNVTTAENGCNPPEAVVDGTCEAEAIGELQDNLYFSLWMDNGAGKNACNNIKDEDETYIIQNTKVTDVKWPIADSQHGGNPITDTCIGVSWNVPSGVNNIIQGDSVTGDITFSAYQSKNNNNFVCNPQKTGTLTVYKNVINDDEVQGDEDLEAADFTINVSGTNPNPSSFPGNENGTVVTLEPGSYSVSEDPVVGYNTTFSTDCSGSIAAGETKSCTVTNDDQGCFEQADVMLVLDRSQSIDTGERAQLKAAAHAFVTAMNPDGGVHMGQTSFSDTGSLDQHLTASATAINAAIDALAGGTYTNLYQGINKARLELDDSNTTYERPSVPDYMVIITDGRPNRPSPESTARAQALSEATTAKTAGVTIYVVGVGSDVDSVYLKQIASGADHYYGIADYDDLQAILTAIANCETPELPPQPNTLFSDDFNDGDYIGWTTGYFETPDSNWDTDITVRTTGAYEGQSLRMEDEAGIYQTIPTTDYKDIKVSYCRRTESIGGTDIFRIGWKVGSGSLDWSDYTQFEGIQNNVSWNCVNFDLPASANDTSITIASYLDNGEGDYGWLDNVVVTGIPL